MEKYIEYYEKNVCAYCKNKKCSRAIVVIKEENEITLKCKEYKKKEDDKNDDRQSKKEI